MECTIEGLEEVEVLRWGYAVEYDHLATDQLRADLHVGSIRGKQPVLQAGRGRSGIRKAARMIEVAQREAERQVGSEFQWPGCARAECEDLRDRVVLVSGRQVALYLIAPS